MDATNPNPGAFPPPTFPPPQGFPPPSSWPPPSAPSTPPPGAPRRHRRPAGLVAAAAVGLALGGLALVAGPRFGSDGTPAATNLAASGTLDVNAIAAKVDPPSSTSTPRWRTAARPPGPAWCSPRRARC